MGGGEWVEQGVDNNVVIIPSANVYTSGAVRVREEGEGGQGCQIFFSTFTVLLNNSAPRQIFFKILRIFYIYKN